MNKARFAVERTFTFTVTLRVLKSLLFLNFLRELLLCRIFSFYLNTVRFLLIFIIIILTKQLSFSNIFPNLSLNHSISLRKKFRKVKVQIMSRDRKFKYCVVTFKKCSQIFSYNKPSLFFVHFITNF